MIERYSRPQMKAVWSDENKYEQWLQVEIAVCRAWADEGVVPREAISLIEKARVDFNVMDRAFQRTRHDVTAFLEAVASTLGPESRFVHLGLTSNDIWDTATCLQMMESVNLLLEDAEALKQVLEERAVEFKDTLMMGRTHGVHAEPITFGLKLLLWSDEMRRNIHRLHEARQTIAVGKISGAVGTHATVPPSVEEVACRALGLDVAPVSNQIIQRDRHAQFVTTLAVIAASLEKFATEIRGLQRTEVREAEEPFAAGQTGSSAMPHKRNPELSERVCGLARLIRGHAVTALENVALWHERDISHSSAERLILPDSCLALDYITDIFTGVMRGLRVYPDRMRENVELTQGLVFSQRVMLALIEKGLSRDEAYGITQRDAMRVWEENTDFRDVLRADPEVTAHLPGVELETLFDYAYYTRYVDATFQRLGLLKAGAG